MTPEPTPVAGMTPVLPWSEPVTVILTTAGLTLDATAMVADCSSTGAVWSSERAQSERGSGVGVKLSAGGVATGSGFAGLDHGLASDPKDVLSGVSGVDAVEPAGVTGVRWV